MARGRSQNTGFTGFTGFYSAGRGNWHELERAVMNPRWGVSSQNNGFTGFTAFYSAGGQNCQELGCGYESRWGVGSQDIGFTAPYNRKAEN